MTNTIDRRSFLIAGSLTALASSRAFGANNTIRVGVIGAGSRIEKVAGLRRAIGHRTAAGAAGFSGWPVGCFTPCNWCAFFVACQEARVIEVDEVKPKCVVGLKFLD